MVGASLGGLAAANVLHQLGFTVDVFERSDSTFEAKGHGLGYVDVDLWEELRGTQMRRGGQQASRAQGAFYYGDLWKFLYEGLPRGTLRLGRSVSSLGNDTYKPRVDGEGEVYDMAVIADGGWSILRHYFSREVPFYSGYVVWRGSVDADHAPGFNSFGVFKEGHLDTIALPLTTDSGRASIMLGFFLATPEAGIVRPKSGAGRHTTEPEPGRTTTTSTPMTRTEREPATAAAAAAAGGGEGKGKSVVPDWFLPLYRQKFSCHAGGELVRLMEAVLEHGKMTPHPQFEFGTDAVTSGRCVMIGDAAHLASPRTAVGAHTAVLDAMDLRQAFSRAIAEGSDDVIASGLAMYSRSGVQRARDLHWRSLDIGRQFWPGGGQGAIVSPWQLLDRTWQEL